MPVGCCEETPALESAVLAKRMNGHRWLLKPRDSPLPGELVPPGGRQLRLGGGS
jgi:hypothetical protein